MSTPAAGTWWSKHGTVVWAQGRAEGGGDINFTPQGGLHCQGQIPPVLYPLQGLSIIQHLLQNTSVIQQRLFN